MYKYVTIELSLYAWVYALCWITEEVHHTVGSNVLAVSI